MTGRMLDQRDVHFYPNHSDVSFLVLASSIHGVFPSITIYCQYVKKETCSIINLGLQEVSIYLVRTKHILNCVQEMDIILPNRRLSGSHFLISSIPRTHKEIQQQGQQWERVKQEDWDDMGLELQQE
ncbi:hypothetical protein CHS0354_010302 [Potamilus streckersoni]|uniref:Uncharacterized protein n=1 Tax=Potamilus streckersoni TaxID=2493646 RepID=A0AAE0TBQ1_9BIVA|nr:hypothetical protein CHS0354_010302 [Potamilus streckersoni]